MLAVHVCAHAALLLRTAGLAAVLFGQLARSLGGAASDPTSADFGRLRGPRSTSLAALLVAGLALVASSHLSSDDLPGAIAALVCCSTCAQLASAARRALRAGGARAAARPQGRPATEAAGVPGVPAEVEPPPAVAAPDSAPTPSRA